MLTAVLVDGGFFLHRYSALHAGRYTASQIATAISSISEQHAGGYEYLYRIFYYDCPPLQKKAMNPVTKREVDFSKTETAKFRLTLFEELKRRRKVALRLGHLQDGQAWNIRSQCVRDLLSGRRNLSDLTEQDVAYDKRQKGVDMRVGLDIASLAYKRLVRCIVLVAGDSDFVPAAKLARREGIHFVLDPMWQKVAPSLFEHIDDLTNHCSTAPTGTGTSDQTKN